MVCGFLATGRFAKFFKYFLFMEEGGQFQRYVWVQGERKRQRNRERYEETRKRYLESAVEEVESPKKARVVWPGEFEKQLKRRERNLAKLDNLKREEESGTPAVQTPSDSQSLSSEEIEKVSDEEDTKVEEPKRKPKKVEKVEKTQEPDITTTDNAHYLDEFLDSPKKLKPAKSGGSFFLVSSNLLNN